MTAERSLETSGTTGSNL